MRVVLFLAFSAFSIVYALWKGGKPERVAAMMLLAATAATAVVGLGLDYVHVPTSVAVVDGLLTILLVGLSAAANRLWLIPLAACQLASFLGHLTKLLAPDLVPLGYAFLITFWAWPMTALLVFGTWCHQQRMKAGYLDRPWKASFRSSVPERRD